MRFLIRAGKKFFSPVRLQRKLLLACVATAIVPLLVLTLYIRFQLIPVMQREILMNSHKTLEQINLNIDSFIQEIHYQNSVILQSSELERAVTADPGQNRRELLGHYRTLKNLIHNFKGARNNLVDFTIVGINGEVYSTAIYDANFDFLDFEPYQKMLRERQSSYVPLGPVPYIFQKPDRIAILYLNRIMESYGTRDIGYIITDVDIRGLERLFDKATEGEWYILTDERGQVLVDTNPGGAEFQQLLQTPTDQTVRELNGEKYFVARMQSDYTHFSTWMISPASQIYREVNRMNVITGVLVTVSLAAVLLLGSAFLNPLIRPIQKLQQYVKQLEGENYENELVMETSDEIGDLANDLNHVRRRIRNLVENIYQEKLLRQEMELLMLQAQINPHFLYNTIQVISSMAQADGNEDIPRICRDLAEMFRYNMDISGNSATLREELKHVRNYLDILSVRYEDRLNVTFQVEEAVYSYRTQRHILQPLVENAVKHGLTRCTNRMWHISLRAGVADEKVVIKITDDGVGIPPQKLRELNESFAKPEFERIGHDAIGLRNVNNRLKLRYGSDYRLVMESCEGKGTTVTVTLPAGTEEESPPPQ